MSKDALSEYVKLKRTIPRTVCSSLSKTMTFPLTLDSMKEYCSELAYWK